MKTKNWKLKILIFLLVLAIGDWRLAIPTHAQGLSLGIWPPLLEAMIQPGKSITQVYKLQNESETDLVVKSSLVPFKPADEKGSIELSDQRPVTGGQSFLDWFSFQNAEFALGEPFALKAGSVQEIVLKLKTPQGAKEDDYYATLLFETVSSPADSAGSSGTFSTIRIGSNILLTVSTSGGPPKKAEISDFSLKNPLFQLPIINYQLLIIDSFDRPEFLVRIQNTGRTFFKPLGTITTTGWLGRQYTLDLLGENVLANSIRQISCTGYKKQPGPCHLKTRFLFGPYRAKLEFGLDKAGGEYQPELFFIALPIKLILGLLAIILLSATIKSGLKIGRAKTSPKNRPLTSTGKIINTN